MTDQQLLKEILIELKGLRQDLKNHETRDMLVAWQGEVMVDRALQKHVNHVRAVLGRVYEQAKENGNQAIVEALENSPVRILPEESKEVKING